MEKKGVVAINKLLFKYQDLVNCEHFHFQCWISSLVWDHLVPFCTRGTFVQEIQEVS